MYSPLLLEKYQSGIYLKLLAPLSIDYVCDGGGFVVEQTV